jgi:hypothetical protein
MPWAAAAMVLAAGMLLGGCGSSDAPQPPQGAGADPVVRHNLAKLAPDDRQAAERQRLCPVTQEPLGSMGVPLKLRVQQRDVFVCCRSCRDPLEQDPDKYLARLPETELTP